MQQIETDKAEWPTTTRGRKKYDWGQLFDGGVYRLERGEEKDYQVETDKFIGQVRSAGNLRRKSVKVAKIDEDTIQLQVTGDLGPKVSKPKADAPAAATPPPAAPKTTAAPTGTGAVTAPAAPQAAAPRPAAPAGATAGK